jgi:Zn-dependent protease with chaperone function
MDFFEAQDRAKRMTGKLVALYLIAVILIIISVYLVALVIFGTQAGLPEGASTLDYIWNPDLFLVVSTIILITIVMGSLYRISQLRRGGAAVAEMLGGRKVEPSTQDQKERQLVNIVEEMSIASGIPVPDIYLLDNEENINAFAAGYGSSDAAVGITRGALEQLNRDEIQGVIAHEFSHVFNGDMRLNIRLIGILNGILVLHIAGMVLMRSTMYSGAARRSSNRGQGGGNATIAIILFGLALVIIGYIGMIFGRMIQAAISRQREYLADAAAVQYTRNPDGLAGALRKIGQKKHGGKINDGHSMEMSHLFFASSFHSALDMLFATHPPLEKRIKALDPSFDKEHEKMKAKIEHRLEKDRISGSKSAAGKSAMKSGLPGKEIIPGLRPEIILAAIGTLQGEQLSSAGKMLSSMPQNLRQAAHEPLDAEALIYGLLITGQSSKVDVSLPDWLEKELDKTLAGRLVKLLPDLAQAQCKWYLPLAELSLPALRKMSRDQYLQFRKLVKQLALTDNRISLFEFALEKMIIRQLDNYFSERKKPEIKHHHLKPLGKELSILLSALAYASGNDVKSAFDAGKKSIEKLLPDNVKMLDKNDCGPHELDTALDEFAASANPVKKYVITAAIYTVTHDNKVSLNEADLLRAVGEALDTPIPIMAGEDLSLRS